MLQFCQWALLAVITMLYNALLECVVDAHVCKVLEVLCALKVQGRASVRLEWAPLGLEERGPLCLELVQEISMVS